MYKGVLFHQHQTGVKEAYILFLFGINTIFWKLCNREQENRKYH